MVTPSSAAGPRQAFGVIPNVVNRAGGTRRDSTGANSQTGGDSRHNFGAKIEPFGIFEQPDAGRRKAKRLEMKERLKRLVIVVRGKRVVSFDECSEQRQPLVSEVDGRIVFLDSIRNEEVKSLPRSEFESAHGALSWIISLGHNDWFTTLHLRLLLKLLGVGLPTVKGVCDPAETACTPLPANLESKGEAA